MCLASGLSAEIEAPPRFPGASLRQALHGGEDYELLFAAAKAFDPSKLIAKTGIPITRIGTFSRSFKGVCVRRNSGKIAPLKQGGWDHLRKALP